MAKMKKRFGIKGQISVNGTQSRGVGDLTLSVSRITTDILRKGSNFKKQLHGPYEMTLEFDIDWDETDPMFTDLKESFEGDDVSVLVEITDGTATTFTATCVCVKFDQNHPKEDVMVASVGLSLDANDTQDPVFGPGTTP